jgi:hypothetical protein
MFPVDLADKLFEVLALDDGNADLLHGSAPRSGPPPPASRQGTIGEQLADGDEPPVDALGVIKAVDAQHDHIRAAELFSSWRARACTAGSEARLIKVGRVDRYRERSDPDPAPVVVQRQCPCPTRLPLVEPPARSSMPPPAPGTRRDRHPAAPRVSAFAMAAGGTALAVGTGYARRTRCAGRPQP